MNGEQTITNKPVVADIGRGAGWLIDGFGYFSKAPLAWIGSIFLLIIIFIVMSVIPLLGGLAAQILMPVFFAGLLIGCHAQDSGGEFTVNHLFAGFSRHTSQLVLLGVIYTIGIILISIAMVIIIFVLPGGVELARQMESGDIEQLRNAMRTFTLVILIGSALYLPLLMAYWFAPALVALDDMSPVAAMKLSFTGCLYNILPFLVYGIVGLVFCFIAAIPFLLGYLIFIPVATASIYISYREIFKSSN